VLRLSALVLGSLLTCALPLACVYDPDDRCGPHQQPGPAADQCACEVGYVPGPEGCVACGEHERDSNGACVCVDGYARPADGSACEEIPAALGADCDSSTPCADPYPMCHESADAAGYCTRSCKDDADCVGGYRCHQAGADSFCRRPRLGHGDACATDEDCADGEATFCETIQSKLCLVPCAAGHTDACFEGEVCCDFAVFSPICVPQDACTPKGGAELQ